MKKLFIWIFVYATVVCQAVTTVEFVTGPASITSSSQPWDTATVTVTIDLLQTAWVAWNDLSEVSLTHTSRPGETLLGPGGGGVDDYIRVTVTNPLGTSQTLDLDRNTIWGNSYGPQNVIYGSSVDAPDVYRRSPSFGQPANTDYFLDEEGAFNAIFTESGDYTFKFDFMDNSTGPSAHGNIYLLVETFPAPLIGHSVATLSNVSVLQREGTKLIDVFYDVSCDVTNEITVSLFITNGTSAVTAPSLSGDVGAGVVTGSVKHILWDAGADWPDSLADLTYTLFIHEGNPVYGRVAKLARTGQTISYYAADDGDLQIGAAWPNPRFIDAGNGCVLDSLTGLEWVKSPHLLAGNSAKAWGSAVTFCNGLSFAGKTDWRCPSKSELMSLVDYSQTGIALPTGHPFIGIITNGNYWTSSTYADDYDTEAAWSVTMRNGLASSQAHKNNAMNIWPVRAGDDPLFSRVRKTGQQTSYRQGDDGDVQAGVEWPEPRFVDNGNGTVTDELTGLEWIKEPHSLSNNSGYVSWFDALDYCSSLNYANHSGWRMPNVLEMDSLVHIGKGAWGENPFAYLNSTETPFSGIKGIGGYGRYWTSTTDLSLYPAASRAIHIEMFHGGQNISTYKNDGCYLWPVRNADIEPIVNTEVVMLDTDTRDYELSVSSAYGSPLPGIGTQVYAWKSTVTCSVYGVLNQGGTNYTCSGWHGTGSVSALGGGTNTGPIVLSAESSSIDWRWIADADADRLPDDWELLYFGSTTEAVATNDVDGDGYLNWEEHILGSNPTNGGSSFLFQPGTNQPSGNFSIDFTTVIDRLYTVECTDNLKSGNWQVLTNFVGDGSSAQIIDPSELPSCFYHVKIDWVE